MAWDSIDTDALAAAQRDLAEKGVGVIHGVLNTSELARVKDAFERAIEEDKANGVPVVGFGFDPDDRNVRLFDLVNKDSVWRELVEHPLALTAAKALLGPSILLSNFSGNRTAPGSGPMGMHADQGYVPPPWPYPSAFNVAWAIDDFTVEVGATRYVPGSHLRNHGPSPEDAADAIPIECPAGSIFLLDGRTWHQTGPNTSKDTTRIGLFAYYILPFLRPQWNWYTTMRPEVLAGASEELREMLGYGSNPTSGLEALYLQSGHGGTGGPGRNMFVSSRE